MKLRENTKWNLIFILMLVFTIFSATATEYDVLVNEDDGKVDYIDTIESEHNLTTLESAVTIENAYISVDTSSYPELNVPATITFYDVDLTNPIMTKNGWWQPDTYAVYQGEGEFASNYECSVEGFSIWEMVESDFSEGTFNQTSIYGDDLSLEPDVSMSLTFEDGIETGGLIDDSAYELDIDLSIPAQGDNCKYDGCLSFNKSNNHDYLMLNNDGLNPSSNFSWCAWHKPVADTTNKRIVYNMGGSGGWYFMHSVTAYNRVYIFNITDNAVNIELISDTTDKWTHYCMSLLNNNNVTFYVDGDLIGSVNIGEYKPSSYDHMLFSSQSLTHAYNGDMECVQMWNTPLNSSQIADVNNSVTCDETLHMPSHTWKLDEYEKIQEDSVGDVDVDMGAFWTNESAYGDKAMEFDGIDDYIAITDSVLLDMEDEITFSTWIKADSLSDYDAISMKVSTGSWNDGYGFYFLSNKLHFFINNYLIDAEIGFTDTTDFHHLVGRYNGTHVDIFVDGIQGTSYEISTNITTTNTDLMIGQANYGGTRFFNGKIDELKIFDRALTQTEITELYNDNPSKKFFLEGDYITKTHNASDYDPDIEEQVWFNLTLGYVYNMELCGGYCNPPEITQTIYAQSSTDNVTWSDWELGTLEFSNSSISLYTFEEGSLQGKYVKAYIGYSSSDSEYSDLIDTYSITGFKALKPSTSDLTIYPVDVTALDNIYANATFNLDDTDTGLSMVFKWYANDVQIYTETINGLEDGDIAVSTLPPYITSKDEVVYFTATPIGSLDVEGDTVQSDNITIGNANFSIIDYSPSQQNITMNIPNTYTFNIELDDPDNDVVCNWTLNGEYVYTGLPYVFNSGNFYAGMNELEAVCSDGEYTQSVSWNLTLEETDLTLPMILGLAFVTFIFLYFAFNLDKEHFLLKLLLIFFSLITLVLIPTTLISGVNAVKDNFLRVGLWFFRIFVVYFSIYLFYHWTKKTEVLKKWFKV